LKEIAFVKKFVFQKHALRQKIRNGKKLFRNYRSKKIVFVDKNNYGSNPTISEFTTTTPAL
jgi:hypothetical protein